MPLRNFKLAVMMALAVIGPRPALADSKPPEGMALVPGGSFIMGTNRSEAVGPNIPRINNDARPQHEVDLPAFFIDKLDVTNAQYKRYCEATGYPVPPNWTNGGYAAGDENFPVTYVDWWEASAYATWAGKRLPTEAEWEKAARGTDGRSYPWGNRWEDAKAVADTSQPQPVGSKPEGATIYAGLDMAGNVFQWVQDWYDAYPGAPLRFVGFGKEYKVIRGGSYLTGEQQARSFFRCVARQSTRSLMIGFRCAVTQK